MALALIAAHVVLVAWSTSTTWFKQDDYALLLRASTAGGFPGTLSQDFIGHLFPGQLALISAVHGLFGMNWTAVVLITALLQFMASFFTWRVLRSIFGRRPVALLLLVTYLTSVLAFQPVMWWCTVVLYLPLQIAFPAALLLMQRALRTRSRIDAALPAVVILLGALFFEKALTITPFLILLVASTKVLPTSSETARERLKEAKAPLIWVTGITIIYGVIYQILTRNSPYRPQFETSRLSNISLDSLTHLFLPSFTGGPLPVGTTTPRFATLYFTPSALQMSITSVQVWATALVVVGLIAWSLITFRTGLRFWLMIAGFFLANLLTLVFSGRQWIPNPRYYAELLFPTVVLLGLATGASAINPPVRRRPVSIDALPRGRPIRIGAGCAVAISMIFVASINMNEIRKVMEPAPAKAYSENALRTSAEIGRPVSLIRQFAPGDIINGIFLNGVNFTETVLAPLSGPWNFSDASTDPYMVLDDGSVVPATTSHETVPFYTSGLCNLDLVDGTSSRLQLNGDPFPWTWYGSLTAATKSDVTIAVDWNQGPTTFTLPAGVSRTLFFIPGGGDSLQVTVEGGDVCVVDLGFGNLMPDQSR